jgi:hypothetical protein
MDRAAIEVAPDRGFTMDVEASQVWTGNSGVFVPYGKHDAETLAMCRAAETVFSIATQEVDTTTSELLRGRTKVDPSDPIEFFLKFNGAYQWMEYTLPLKKTLRSMFGKQMPNIGSSPTESIQVTAGRMAMRLR